MSERAPLRVVATHDFCCAYQPSPTSYGSLPGGEGLKNTVEALRAPGPIGRGGEGGGCGVGGGWSGVWGRGVWWGVEGGGGVGGKWRGGGGGGGGGGEVGG